MRFPTRLLMLPLVIGAPGRPANGAYVKLSSAPMAADSVPESVRWNRLVPDFAAEAAARRKAVKAAAIAAHDSVTLRQLAQNPPPFHFRIYTIMSVAQYAAATAATSDRTISSDVAIANASAAVLNQFFPDSAVRASISRELARDMAKAGSITSDRVNAAKAVGDDASHRAFAFAPAFNMIAPWNGTIPKGPGMWYSAPGIPPIGVTLTQSHTWLLDSVSQFRPGPPLLFGSPAYKAALDEVKRVAIARTPAQTEIAQRWDGADPWDPWNDTASASIRQHHVKDPEAARVLAMMNLSASDAILACFDAKYTYWSIRPSQADTSIVLADSVGLPNFPSYPSGHACSAGAFDASLGSYFPQDRAKFTRMAEEQAMSRLYGGIHYRFDNDGGLALGRIVVGTGSGRPDDQLSGPQWRIDDQFLWRHTSQ